MYSGLTIAKKFIVYYLNASSGVGHGIHSPFLFDFISEVLTNHKKFPIDGSIELLRKKLLSDTTHVVVEDFGAGSRIHPHISRTISQIVKTASINRKFGQLLFRMCQYYRPRVILEMGTSLGLSTAYLSAGNPDAQVITLEGSRGLAVLATEHFRSLGLTNIKVLVGNFDHQLSFALNNLTTQGLTVDLAFIDGNHRMDATVEYFNQLVNHLHLPSLIICDDIHWSQEMEKAWEVIKKDPRVFLTVDLFFMGIVFFRSDFKTKQHFVIRF